MIGIAGGIALYELIKDRASHGRHGLGAGTGDRTTTVGTSLSRLAAMVAELVVALAALAIALALFLTF